MSHSDSLANEVSVTERTDSALVAAIAAHDGSQNELYLRYRRPLMQIFLQRRIDRDTAQDLLQRTFLQAIRKIRAEGLEDPGKLGGYLYRTACNLATAYWRGEISRREEHDHGRLETLKDAAPSLEESVDHERLARSVHELLRQLPVPRDREVLERLYIREESRVTIRESLKLTEPQLNQVLWRARQRFGDLLRKQGRAGGRSEAAHSMDG